jgi:hypothetical protein
MTTDEALTRIADQLEKLTNIIEKAVEQHNALDVQVHALATPAMNFTKPDNQGEQQ